MKGFLKNIIKNKADDNKADKSLIDSKSLFSPLRKYAIGAGVGFFSFLMIIVVIVIIVFGPIFMVKQYFDDKVSSVSLFFEKVGNLLTFRGWCADSDGSCQADTDQKYLEKLNSVYESYKDKGVELDTDLITGTIFYGSSMTSGMFTFDSGEDAEELVEDRSVHLSDVSKLASNMVNGNSIDYEGYRRYLINTYIPKRFSNAYSSDREIENIADEIMNYARNYGKMNLADGDCSFEQNSQTSINVDANFIKSTYVNVLSDGCKDYSQCKNNIEQTVPLKEYVMGVAYREIHAGSQIKDEEAIKANLIAIKSFTLSKRKGTWSGDKYYVNMLNHTNDQVYCNMNKGCMEYKTTNILPAASSSEIELVSRLYDEVANEFIYDTKNNNFWGAYTASKSVCLKIGLSTNCMSQNDSFDMAKQGQDYKAILSTFYTQNMGILDINNSTISVGSYICHNNGTGTIAGNTYISNPPNYDNISQLKNNYNSKYYFGSYFQCVWFARGRAQEIILNSNMPEDLKQKAFKAVNSTRGNGESWYRNSSLSMFNKSTDLYAAKPGSIVSWSGGSVFCSDINAYCGHVGIIEDVKYDENGRAKSVIFSDSWNNARSGIGYRKREVSMDKLRVYNPKYVYRFNGYVYLLD